MKNKLRSLYLLSPILFIGLSVNAASFDCKKAQSFQEKTICSDPQLSALDEQLNTSYKDAIKRSDAKKILVLWQREWLKYSDIANCKDAKCLIKEFSSRITTLDSVATKNTSAAQWNGHYSRFFQGNEDDDTATINLIGLNGDQIYISGMAIWRGPNADKGQINDGQIEGIGKLKSGKAYFDFDGCNAKVALNNNELLVEDESGCGGLNVTFIGDYKKADFK